MFKIGDEVICIKDNTWCEKGDWGIVTGFSDIGNPLIDFKERKEGKSYKLYIESENLQLKNQSIIKPEDMVSGEWYEYTSKNSTEKWLIKFKSFKENRITTYKSYAYDTKCYFSGSDNHNVIKYITNLKKVTKEQVLEYFPDEFKEPVNLDNRFKPNTWYKTTDNPYTFYVKNPFENGGLDSFKMKKQSKNNKPVLLKEQKLVNLSIKKQTKKSILLCQH